MYSLCISFQDSKRGVMKIAFVIKGVWGAMGLQPAGLIGWEDCDGHVRARLL